MFPLERTFTTLGLCTQLLTKPISDSIIPVRLTTSTPHSYKPWYYILPPSHVLSLLTLMAPCHLSNPCSLDYPGISVTYDISTFLVRFNSVPNLSL